jgi:hypothetical protein
MLTPMSSFTFVVIVYLVSPIAWFRPLAFNSPAVLLLFDILVNVYSHVGL